MNQAEYGTLTKALLADMVLERRKKEMHGHLSREFSNASVNEVGDIEKPDI